MNEPTNGSAGTSNSFGGDEAALMFFVFTAGHFPTDDASNTVAALIKRHLRRSFLIFDSLNMLLAHFVALSWDDKANALTDSIILDDARLRERKGGCSQRVFLAEGPAPAPVYYVVLDRVLRAFNREVQSTLEGHVRSSHT
jgi:hypothetical protein